MTANIKHGSTNTICSRHTLGIDSVSNTRKTGIDLTFIAVTLQFYLRRSESVWERESGEAGWRTDAYTEPEKGKKERGRGREAVGERGVRRRDEKIEKSGEREGEEVEEERE